MIRHRLPRLPLLAFAVLLAFPACSSFTDLDDFEVLEGVRPPFGEPDQVTVTAGAGRIDLAGVMSTGSPCQDFHARVAREGRSLTVRIVATSRPVACPSAVARWAYEAHVDRLAAGEHHLTVLHVNGPWGGVMFDGVVMVDP